ncbi:MAG: hypothetical protein IT162_19495 [Bryobacterales bacterium]|nr:hypothetical protein [Bryobacterales bacterium]
MRSVCGGAALAAVIYAAQSQPRGIVEASGVTRAGDVLLVVDDSDIGAYFRVPLPKPSALKPLLDLNTLKPHRVELKNKGLGVDLESIAMLADGRVALLSERLRSLVSDTGIIAEYDSELAEIGKRGLEGLAVRPLPGGASRVAAMWEGGYADFGQMPRGAQVRSAWLPLVVVHDVPRNAQVGRVRLRDAVASIELTVPRPPGAEPEAQRFRAPDLVWTRLSAAPDDWGFIVLLSSQNGVARPTFALKWLQRFNLEGKPVGEPFDLATVLPAGLAAVNWEGLCWFEPGKRLVMVHEAEPKVPPHAFLIDLPSAWQFNPGK